MGTQWTWKEVKGDIVSIQLMSPASGDLEESGMKHLSIGVSIQLMSPASGDNYLHLTE